MGYGISNVKCTTMNFCLLILTILWFIIGELYKRTLTCKHQIETPFQGAVIDLKAVEFGGKENSFDPKTITINFWLPMVTKYAQFE